MTLYQYGLELQDRVVLVMPSQFKIGYGISTLAGESGSPVVVDDAIIAVHVGGSNFGGKKDDEVEFNVGRTVDTTLITNLKRWAK